MIALSSGGDVEEAKRLVALVATFDKRKAADWLMREVRWAEDLWQVAIKAKSPSKIQARQSLATRIYALQIFMDGLDSHGQHMDTAERETEGS